MVGWPCLFGPDQGEFVGRVAVGVHGVDADDPADRLGGVGPVAGDQNHPGDARGAQGADHPGRLRAERILEQQRPGGCPVDRHEHAQRAVEVGAAAGVPDPRR